MFSTPVGNILGSLLIEVAQAVPLQGQCTVPCLALTICLVQACSCNSLSGAKGTWYMYYRYMYMYG